MDANLKDQMYKSFEDQFTYETESDKMDARSVWEKRSKISSRRIWAKERLRCKRKSGSRNHADWKELKADFLFHSDWLLIIESWMENKWRKLLEQGAKNKASVPREEPSSCENVANLLY